MRLQYALVLVALSMSIPRLARGADYGGLGSHAVDTSDLPANAGGSSGGKLVVPKEPGGYPLLIASHGWSASADNQVGWAQHFASWGFVVVAPTFPNALSPDAKVNLAIIKALVSMYETPPSGSPASGKVDGTRLGLEGHSAGGLATTLAAAELKPQATVLFDPVDKDDAGKGAYESLCSPLLGLFANASSCNNSAEWSTFKTASLGPTILFNVVGSSHCDGENADRGAACGLFCGGAADPKRQAVYGRYATAFFLANLTGDGAAAAALTAQALAADTAISDSSVRGGASCASPIESDAAAGVADAGVSPSGSGDDAGRTSGGGGGGGGGGGASVDASSAASSPADGDTSAASSGPSSSSGCACTTAGGESVASVAWLVLVALAVSFVRRRARAVD